ncbi:MAG: CYTH domain-containing protein [Bacteroidaceae bacterium]|nr:CYTH domain-containing protein [Bacteroidaceae bacterium]
MPLEIERKFLVRDDTYKALAASHTRIVQGYICNESGRTVRVRLRGDEAFLTIKGPSRDGGLSRYEFEKALTPDEGLSLLSLCQGGVVEKVRWLVPLEDGHVVEVDEFKGLNAGLVMAEVELKSAADDFPRPAFLAEEVTGDRRYYNSQLLRHPFTTW